MRHEDHSVASTEASFMPGPGAFASTPATGRVVGHAMDSFPSHRSDDPSWSASLESPLTRLDREVQNFSREDSAASSKLPSLHFDELSDDEHTVVRPRPDKGKGKEPLLQNVLRNTLYSVTSSDISLPTRSPVKGKLKTPVPKGLNPYLPPDVEPSNWSGLVDLRHTPLATPQKNRNPIDSDDDDSFDGLPPGMSPPVLMSPAKPPRSTAELQLLWGKTPAKEAASRIKNDLVRDVQRQNSEKARGFHGYGTSGVESSMSTVSSPPSLSRYNRPDTDESAVDESLESVMQRVTLNPPSWTPTVSTPGLRIRKATAAPAPMPSYMPPPAQQYQDAPVTPQHYDAGGDAYDSDSDSLDEEVNNTAHPSAAFLMAQAASGSGGSFDEDDSFQSQDSLDQPALVDLGGGVVDVHPFARGGYAYNAGDAGDDSFDDESFDAGVPEETVFGRPPAQRAQARMSEAGDLLMYGDEVSAVPDTMQYGMVGSSPTPHYSHARG